MGLIRRITTPLTALLPDVNNVPPQRLAVGAILASIVAHVLLVGGYFLASRVLETVWKFLEWIGRLLLIALFTMLGRPVPSCEHQAPKVEVAAPAVSEPLTVELVLPEAPKEEPAPVPKPKEHTAETETLTASELDARARMPVISSTGLTPTADAPKNPAFESDENMKLGGSEIAPTGSLPLPAQDGRKDVKTLDFIDQRGKVGSPEPGSMGPENDTPTADPVPMTLPALTDPAVAGAKAEPAPPAPDLDKPAPAEPADAESMPKVMVNSTEGDLVVAVKKKDSAESERAAVTEIKPTPPAFRVRAGVPNLPTREMEMAKLTTPPPDKSTSRSGSYREEQIKSRIEGSAPVGGPKGVDALKTPWGIYMKQVRAAFGSRCLSYIRRYPDRYTPGSVTVAYSITKEGKIRDLKVVENSSNWAFAELCKECVYQAKLAPPPEEAHPLMQDGKIEDEYTFTLLPPF